jgi:hypothetical protein
LCQKAEERASRFDRDAFVDGMISACFADVERALGDKRVACNHKRKVIEKFESVPASHRSFEQAKSRAIKDRKEFKDWRC